MKKKIVYFILYGLIIISFIYLGSKDYNKVTYQNDAERFYEEYNIPKDNHFIYIGSTELIRRLKNDNSVIFIGDKENEWSKEYANILYEIKNDIKVENIYYYDARRVKMLMNRNYYDIIKALEGNLIETDDSNNNLFTPSLYIVKDGKIVFHDSTSAVVNNEDLVTDFWAQPKREIFKQKLIEAINNNS